MGKHIVMVTGGGGYLGSVMVPKLVKKGYRVRVLDRFFFGQETLGEYATHKGVELVQDDIRYCAPDVFKGVSAVVHLAALSNDPSCELDSSLTRSINLTGSIRVGELAKRAGVSRLLFSSSCSMYGKSENQRVTEDSPLAPVSLYAKYKIEAERELLNMSDRKFHVTSLRNPTLFGLSPRMRFDLVINIMTQYAVRQGKIFITGTGQQWRPLMHVADCADAFITILGAPISKVSGRPFNVGATDNNFQVISIAQMVKNVIPKTVVEIVPDDPDRRSYNVDFALFRKTLKFRPARTAEDGVREIRDALEQGLISDDIRTVTVKYYKWLLDANRIINQVRIRKNEVI